MNITMSDSSMPFFSHADFGSFIISHYCPEYFAGFPRLSENIKHSRKRALGI